MPFRVIIDHPDLGDQDMYIHGLGTFRNGTTTEVSDEQMMLFRATNATVNVSEPHPKTGMRKHVPALAKHPVDLKIYGVRVEEVKDKSDKSDEDKSTGEEGEGE